MILKTEKQKIIKAFGLHYTAKLQSILQQKAITNTKGEVYSPASIRNIINGLQENTELELLFLKETQKELDKQQKLISKRKQLFK